MARSDPARNDKEPAPTDDELREALAHCGAAPYEEGSERERGRTRANEVIATCLWVQERFVESKLKGYGYPTDAAPDIIQNVYISVASEPRTVKGPSASAYLFRSLTNGVIDWIRTNPLEDPIEDPIEDEREDEKPRPEVDPDDEDDVEPFVKSSSLLQAANKCHGIWRRAKSRDESVAARRTAWKAVLEAKVFDVLRALLMSKAEHTTFDEGLVHQFRGTRSIDEIQKKFEELAPGPDGTCPVGATHARLNRVRNRLEGRGRDAQIPDIEDIVALFRERAEWVKNRARGTRQEGTAL